MNKKFKNIKPGFVIMLMTITIWFMADFAVYGLKKMGVEVGGGFGIGAMAADYYVSPSGNDTYPGTFERPWQTIDDSINKLLPGDTLYLREGTYFENNIEVEISGIESNWIKIKNYPGENPIIDGGFQEFRTVPNNDWEVYDAGRKIYRSVQIYSSVDDYAYGYFGQDNDNWKLLTYDGTGPFFSDNQDFSDDGNIYCGPGLYFNTNDNKIYVRLEHSKYQHDLTRFDREYNFPVNTDARQTKMYIFSYTDRIFYISSSAAYIEIDGIDLKYTDNAVWCANGSNHITLKNCKVMGGRYDMQIRDNSHDILVDNVQFNGNVPPWMARSDVKQSDVPPLHGMQGSAIVLDTGPYNIEIRNCTFSHYFDAIDATKNPYNIHIHHNEFNVIRDDVLQLGSGSYDIEVNDNVMTSVVAGVSWNGYENPPVGEAGTKYIHHNIIDASTPMLYGRTDPNNQLDDKYDGPFGTGMATGRAFGMHTQSEITGADPWKVYHNTIIIAQDVSSGGAGLSYKISHYDADYPHEVFNNIIVQMWDADIPSSWYAFVLRNARVQDGSQIFDGNIYYRTLESPYSSHSMFEDIWTVNDGSNKDFERFSDFKADTEYINYTKQYYTPGWENSGVEADPQLDESYRPNKDGPAATGAIDLTSKGWPGVDSSVYRGALAPIEDTTSPTRSNPSPTGTLSAGTTSTAISLTTNESAICKYSITANTAYSSMTNTFTTTGGSSHSTVIAGLEDGQTYTYYVRAEDTTGNTNTDDYEISFSVATQGVGDSGDDGGGDSSGGGCFIGTAAMGE